MENPSFSIRNTSSKSSSIAMFRRLQKPKDRFISCFEMIRFLISAIHGKTCHIEKWGIWSSCEIQWVGKTPVSNVSLPKTNITTRCFPPKRGWENKIMSHPNFWTARLWKNMVNWKMSFLLAFGLLFQVPNPSGKLNQVHLKELFQL